MRWLSLSLLLGVSVLGGTAGSASSGPHGSDIWKVRLEHGTLDRWLLLDAGRIRAQGRARSVFLLGHVRERAPAGRFDAMKVVDGAGGATLWAYDGTGSDYVEASGAGGGKDVSGAGAASEQATRFCGSPRLRDVDGDGSDDVVFVENDFIFGRQLRAVRIEP